MYRKVAFVRSETDVFLFEQDVSGALNNDDDYGATMKPIDDFIDSTVGSGCLLPVADGEVLHFEYEDGHDIYVCRDVIEDFLEKLIKKFDIDLKTW